MTIPAEPFSQKRCLDPEPGWNLRLDVMRGAWPQVTPIQPPIHQLIAGWETRLRSMTATVTQLRQEHRWTRGAADLLTICGVHRRELAHSAALAWLCDPEASHGCGVSLLSDMIALTGAPVALDGPVRVETEVTRDFSRADLTVRSATWTLVIENKIDASESADQCQRLFEDWHEEPGLRMLLLTRTGHAPISARSSAARQAWHAASWHQVAAAVIRIASNGTLDAPGRGALLQYTSTLRRLFGRTRS